MKTTTNAVRLPYLLSFDGAGGYKPGRGEAGWTVATFASAAEEARAGWSHGVMDGPRRGFGHQRQIGVASNAGSRMIRLLVNGRALRRSASSTASHRANGGFAVL